MKLKVGDLVKVLAAPIECCSNWPSMVGHVGFIEELHFDGTRALVRTITIDGEMHRLAFMPVCVLEPVLERAWIAAVAEYRRRESDTRRLKMSEPMDKPINPFDAAKRRSGVLVSLDVHDVQALRPDCGEARARAFLEIHAPVIAHAMLIAGRQVLRELLEGGDAG
jgi:hypothetical protein